MSRKRRQRSTSIRKRIEKKQREDEKQRRKAAKAAGTDEETMVVAEVPRASAAACAQALDDLGQRLHQSAIRGWTPADLRGEPAGLAWLGDALTEALETNTADDPLPFELSQAAQRHLLDRLGALEMAAPGLDLAWEPGFPDLARALSKAEEPPSEDEDEAEE